MIRFIQPLDNKSDFNKLTGALFKFLDDDHAHKFLSYSLIKFDKATIIDSFVFSDNKNMLRLLIRNDFRPVD